jgi:hypothetical protein
VAKARKIGRERRYRARRSVKDQRHVADLDDVAGYQDTRCTDPLTVHECAILALVVDQDHVWAEHEARVPARDFRVVQAKPGFVATADHQLAVLRKLDHARRVRLKQRQVAMTWHARRTASALGRKGLLQHVAGRHTEFVSRPERESA